MILLSPLFLPILLIGWVFSLFGIEFEQIASFFEQFISEHPEILEWIRGVIDQFWLFLGK